MGNTIFLPINSDHLDEIADGILYGLPYSSSAICSCYYDTKNIVSEKPVYRNGATPDKHGLYSDFDIIGWDCVVKKK